MQKNAFTMIELIFIIVILGILAAVAIPKLVATRDDAKVSQIAQNTGIAISEITEYAISNGTTKNNLSDMSNAIGSLMKSGNVAISNGKAIISIDSTDCIQLEIIKSSTNDDLKVSYINTENQKCLSLQSTVDAQNYSIKLRGASVTY